MKKKIIQHLTELMSTIQMAYYKGCETGSLYVHESGEAGISIDLYNFGGDGKPVCDGLTFHAADADARQEPITPFCICYDPDNEQHPIILLCVFGDDMDDFELTPENVSANVLQNITRWLEKSMQPIPKEEKKLMLLCSYDEDERDHGVLLAVSRERFKNDPDAVRKAIAEHFGPDADEDEQELKECIDDLMQEQSGYYGSEYYWKELQVLL